MPTLHLSLLPNKLRHPSGSGTPFFSSQLPIIPFLSLSLFSTGSCTRSFHFQFMSAWTSPQDLLQHGLRWRDANGRRSGHERERRKQRRFNPVSDSFIIRSLAPNKRQCPQIQHMSSHLQRTWNNRRYNPALLFYVSHLWPARVPSIDLVNQFLPHEVVAITDWWERKIPEEATNHNKPANCSGGARSISHLQSQNSEWNSPQLTLPCGVKDGLRAIQEWANIFSENLSFVGQKISVATT